MKKSQKKEFYNDELLNDEHDVELQENVVLNGVTDDLTSMTLKKKKRKLKKRSSPATGTTIRI